MKLKPTLQILIFSFFFILLSLNSFSQSVGDYRSAMSGHWFKEDIWERYNGTIWVAVTTDPASTTNVTIKDGHRVIVDKNNSDCNTLIVETGAVLEVTDANGTMRITGHLTVNGIITSGSKKPFNFVGSNSTTIYLDGTGFVDNVAFAIEGNITVKSTASITFVNDITLYANVVVTNNGNISCNNLYGSNAATSIWTNTANSYLSVGTDLFPVNPPSSVNYPGVLNASASGNTVRYFNAASYVKPPTASTYYNLIVEGTIKTLSSSIIVLNDLTISGQFDVSANNYNITVGGDWTDNSEFIERNGTVTFNGTSDQYITSLIGETFYNLTVNKSSGVLFLSGNATASNTLTMTTGNIYTGTYKLIVGTSTSNLGTLSRTSGTVIGKYEKWLATTSSGTQIVFPVGTSSYYRPITANFATITTGGSVIAQFIASAPGNNGMSPKLTDGTVDLYNTFNEGYWDLTAANSFVPGNYNLSVDGNGFTSFPFEPTTTHKTRIVTRVNSSSTWTANGTHNTVSGTVVSRNTLTTFSAQYALADNNNCNAPVTSTITGITEVCTNSQNVSYSVANHGTSTYYWSVNGGTPDPASSSNSISIDWGSTGKIGSITVYEVNSCTSSSPVTLSVNINPIPPTEITGKANVAELSTNIEYSVINTPNYTYTWTITGGAQDLPDATTDAITVDWGAAGAGNVSVVAVHSTCGNSTPVNLPIRIYNVINSASSDRWDKETTWDCGCIPTTGENVRILSGHNVNTSTSGNISIVNFIIEPSGSLIYNPNTTGSFFTVTGDLTVNGTLNANYSNGSVQVTTSGKDIDGVGNIIVHTTKPFIIKNNKRILSTSDLTVTGSIDLQSPVGCLVTNYGDVTITNSLIEVSNQTNWKNEANSYLAIGNAINMAGSIFVEYTGNTVEYYGSVNQTIKTPASSYYNLITSGSNTKSLVGNIDINGDLTISGTSQIDVTTAPFNINLAGDWFNLSTNADAFVERTGTVNFDGTLLQTINPNSTNLETFYNLTISGSDVQLPEAKNVTVSNATNISGTFTLKSSASGTASFLQSGTYSQTGTVKAERFMTGNKWHFMFPILSTIPTTTYTNDGGYNNTNIYSYSENNEDYWSATTNYGVTGWTPEASSSNLRTDKGLIFNRYTLPDKTFVQTGGTLYTGQKDFTVTRFSGTHTVTIANGCTNDWNYYDGWNLIGNPYSSAIDWNAVTKTGIDGAIYYYSDNGTQTQANYHYYISSGVPGYPGISINNGSRYIPSGQAFMVKKTAAGSSTFSLLNTNRVHSSQDFYKKAEEIAPNILRMEISSNGTTDESVIRTLPSEFFATDNYDGEYDAFKMFSWDKTRPQIYSANSDFTNIFAINSVTDIETSKQIPLGIYAGTSGNYTLNFTEYSFQKMNIYLEDKSTSPSTIINVKAVQSYNFYITAGINTSRFVLNFYLNNSPNYSGAIGEQIISEDNFFQFKPDIAFYDIDLGDIITLTAECPQWLTFNPETITFSGTPSNSDVGISTIRLIASDLLNSQSVIEFSLKVENTNDAPFIQNQISDIEMLNNMTVNIDLQNTFMDVDIDDELSYDAIVTPFYYDNSWYYFNEKFTTLTVNPIEIPDGIYKFSLTATDSYEESVTEEFNVTVSNLSTGIENIENDINIYPNPSTGLYNISVNNSYLNNSYLIKDISGKLLYSGLINNKTFTVDLKKFDAGVYFLIFSDGTTNISNLLFKQ